MTQASDLIARLVQLSAGEKPACTDLATIPGYAEEMLVDRIVLEDHVCAVHKERASLDSLRLPHPKVVRKLLDDGTGAVEIHKLAEVLLSPVTLRLLFREVEHVMPRAFAEAARRCAERRVSQRGRRARADSILALGRDRFLRSSGLARAGGGPEKEKPEND